MRSGRRGVLTLTAACALLGALGAGHSPTSAAPPPPAMQAGMPRALEPIHPIPSAPEKDARLVALGAILFNDKRLSANDTMSCRNCHDTATNGASAQKFDPLPKGGFAARNSPTVFNAALNFRLDWMGDVRTLQEQADESMHDIMQQNAAAAAEKLAGDPAMVATFQDATGHGPDRATILDALADYQQTLLTPQSPFDRWLEGAPDAISGDAEAGYGLFKFLGCVSCHQGGNVGGNLFQQSGVYTVLSDPARPYLRVPSLRNVATTAPYFHDGSAATLPDAVRSMARSQLDRDVSEGDVRQIVAFLTSLTGQFQGHPVRAPDGAH